MGDVLGQVIASLANPIIPFHLDLIAGRESFLKNGNSVFAGQCLDISDDIFDIAGKHINTRDNKHIIEPAGNIDPGMRSTTGTGLSIDRADITRSKANHRSGGFPQGRQDQFAALTLPYRFQRLRMNDFDDQMILGQMQSLSFIAHAGTGAEDIGNAVKVDDLRFPERFDGRPRGGDGTARLASHDNPVDRQVPSRIYTLVFGGFTEIPGIRRRGPDYRRVKFLQDEQQPVGRNRTGPETQRPQVLGAGHIGSPDEQRKIQSMDIAILRPHAGRPEQPALHILECLEILAGKGA